MNGVEWPPYDPEVNPPLLRDQYPRLREGESRILRAYLRDTGTDSVRRLRTAVPVGEGEVPGYPRDKFEKQVKALSVWKVDAVVDRPGRQEVIEIKSRATHTAIGQVIAYDRTLGQRDDEPTTSRPVVAAYRTHPDLPAYADVTGVTLHEVPDEDRSGATRRFIRDRETFSDGGDT